MNFVNPQDTQLEKEVHPDATELGNNGVYELPFGKGKPRVERARPRDG